MLTIPLHRRTRRSLRTGFAVVALSGTVAALVPAGPALAAPRRADVAVSMTASPAEVTATGGATTIDLDVRNAGTDAADDVTVTLTLPPGAGMYGEGTYFAEWKCDVSTAPTWTCVHGPLAAGATAEALRFDLYLPGGAHGEAVTVGAAATTSSRELSTANNTAQATVRYVAADLAVRMTPLPAELIVGGTTTLEITVQNVGAGTADAFRLDLPLADTMQPSVGGGSQGGWECNFGRDVVTGIQSYGCTHAGVAPGEVVEPLWLDATVQSGTPGETLTFTATVRPVAGEVSTDNNTARADVAIVEPGVVRGTLWKDSDRDGQRDADEAASGIYLYKLAFVPQAPADGDPQEVTAVLNSDGTYSAKLKPGPYVVQVWVESRYNDFTVGDIGDDATDSDIVSVEREVYGGIDVGSSAVVDVTAGNETMVDAGVVDVAGL